MSVLDKLQPIFTKVLGAPSSEVVLDASRDQFARWDSWAHLDLVMEIEAEFNCSLTMEETAGINSIRDLADLISRKTGQ
jgi:acyl carrier protein